MIHHTRGLYPSGDYKDNGVCSENIASHIWYNLTMRPGRALIVDGYLIDRGIRVSRELLDKHLAETKDKKAVKDTRPYV